MKKKKIIFFGLLHIQEKENKNLNFEHDNHEEKILVYLKNAIFLNISLKKFHYEFILLTNNEDYLKKLLKRLDAKINILKIKFKTHVPKNTHFFSCHFRVDIFNYLSKLKDTFSILIDLDTLILKKSKGIESIKNTNKGFVNEITSNVIPAYGYDEILNKLKLLDKKINKVEWYGGDFFAGDSKFFGEFYKQTKKFQKLFVKNKKLLTNQTDELFISCAIINLKKSNFCQIENISEYNIFTRYWSSKILHHQKNLKSFIKYDFLHVPADKVFLSKCYNNKNVQNLRKNYEDYINSLSFNFNKKIKSFIPLYLKKIIKNYIL